jgi:hypothetical protein
MRLPCPLRQGLAYFIKMSENYEMGKDIMRIQALLEQHEQRIRILEGPPEDVK